MNKSDPRLRTEVIDGQKLLIPDEEGWQLLHHDPVIDGTRVGGKYVDDIMWAQLRFSQQYTEFLLALRYLGPGMKVWLPLLLLQMPTSWQRVHLEQLTCNICGWQGATANPTDSELYLGVPNRQQVFEKAWGHPVLPCPRCGSKLPRHPIWFEPLKSNK